MLPSTLFCCGLLGWIPDTLRTKRFCRFSGDVPVCWLCIVLLIPPAWQFPMWSFAGILRGVGRKLVRNGLMMRRCRLFVRCLDEIVCNSCTTSYRLMLLVFLCGWCSWCLVSPAWFSIFRVWWRFFCFWCVFRLIHLCGWIQCTTFLVLVKLPLIADSPGCWLVILFRT